MQSFPVSLTSLTLSFATLLLPASAVRAQGLPHQNTSAPRVEIERELVRPIAPDRYGVTLQLEALKQSVVTAPFDGVVRSIVVEPGETVDSQTELARMDDRELRLLVARARAREKAAQAEAALAQEAGGKRLELAEASLEAARAEVALAELQLERSSIRSLQEGRLVRLHVGKGQFTRLGDPLFTVGDLSQMAARIPLRREEAEVDAEIDLRVESKTVEARVQRVEPLDARFDPLRELFDSLVTAVVVFDNPGAEFHIGQTVHSPLVPRYPVVEIPKAAVVEADEGARKVQVVRGNVVRDVEVQVLGEAGEERRLVSGAFAEGDEVVETSSTPLVDGTRLARAKPEERRQSRRRYHSDD